MKTPTVDFYFLFNLKNMNSFLARDVIYTSRATMSVSVCLSVTEVHWRIIANLGFKFNLPRIAVAVHAGAREGIIAGKSGGIISRYAGHC